MNKADRDRLHEIARQRVNAVKPDEEAHALAEKIKGRTATRTDWKRMQELCSEHLRSKPGVAPVFLKSEAEHEALTQMVEKLAMKDERDAHKRERDRTGAELLKRDAELKEATRELQNAREFHALDMDEYLAGLQSRMTGKDVGLFHDLLQTKTVSRVKRVWERAELTREVKTAAGVTHTEAHIAKPHRKPKRICFKQLVTQRDLAEKCKITEGAMSQRISGFKRRNGEAWSYVEHKRAMLEKDKEAQIEAAIRIESESQHIHEDGEGNLKHSKRYDRGASDIREYEAEQRDIQHGT